MGGDPYWYYTNYQPDLNAALKMLREQEFQAGRYNPATPLPVFPITESAPASGAQHLSIEAALEASAPEGTRSILDILRVSDTPCPFSGEEFEAVLLGENFETLGDVFNTAFRLSSTELLASFGTEKPTHEMIESTIFGSTGIDASDAFWHSIARGTARYIIVYAENQPSEIFFFGYSFD